MLLYVSLSMGKHISHSPVYTKMNDFPWFTTRNDWFRANKRVASVYTSSIFYLPLIDHASECLKYYGCKPDQRNPLWWGQWNAHYSNSYWHHNFHDLEHVNVFLLSQAFSAMLNHVSQLNARSISSQQPSIDSHFPFWGWMHWWMGIGC